MIIGMHDSPAQALVLKWLGITAGMGLLVVSCIMNWRFGFSLGRTAFDGHVYGAASVLADIFKAIALRYLVIAIDNKFWGIATAAAIVWLVVTPYSLTSAIGHSALNRMETASQRIADAQYYEDLRADKKRAEEAMSWLPPHRGEEAILADLNGLKANRLWSVTNECNEASIAGKGQREFCQGFQKLNSEFGNAKDRKRYEEKISEIEGKLAKFDPKAAGGADAADPQAAALSRMAKAVGVTWANVQDSQTVLSVFVALLIEVGSNFGLYMALGLAAKPSKAPEVPTANVPEGREGPGKVPVAQPSANVPDPQQRKVPGVNVPAKVPNGRKVSTPAKVPPKAQEERKPGGARRSMDADRTFLNGRKAAMAPTNFGPRRPEPSQVVPAPRVMTRATPAGDDVEKELEKFLDARTRRDEQSALASSELLACFNHFRRGHGLEEISQRRLGDAMAGLGYRTKTRLSGGRVHYCHLAWASDALDLAAHSADRIRNDAAQVLVN
jgi:hypothetical protein